MQLIDDDMDELFRNAAEHYPLKTDGADWNAVLGRLQPAAATPHAASRDDGSGHHSWLWLLLLTPLCFIAHLPRFTASGVAVSSKPVVQQQASIDAGRGEEKKYSQPGGAEATLTPPATYSHYEKAGNTTKAATYSLYETVRKAEPDMSLTENKQPLLATTTLNRSADSTGIVIVDTAVTAFSEQLTDTAASVITQPQVVVTDSNTANNTPVIVKKQVKQQQTKGFYYGILASPDISTVKGQRVANVGYGLGVIVGYRLSERLAIETGVLWDRKYYYSKGDYFSTKKLPVQSYVHITDVDGWCNMYELPLNVRYFFANGKKSSWYVNAGVSSYLMKKESYDYRYTRYGQPGAMSWDYDNATKNWFNIIHAGIGWERRAGVLGTLRVEPYLKASVGGVGIGSLPLTSFGLNVGITRSVKF